MANLKFCKNNTWHEHLANQIVTPPSLRIVRENNCYCDLNATTHAMTKKQGCRAARKPAAGILAGRAACLPACGCGRGQLFF